MPPAREIRADFDAVSIVVYQAYGDAIADAALEAQRFVPPFSYGRMTWIKPSFLWMMERSGWGSKPAQERVLAVRIRREAWEAALCTAVLTSFDPRVHGDSTAWNEAFAAAPVHVQWDPERSIRGAKLEHRSIQVGLGRRVAEAYATDWITEIRDFTPLVRSLARLREAGRHAEAQARLPSERVYPTPPDIRRRLGM